MCRISKFKTPCINDKQTPAKQTAIKEQMNKKINIKTKTNTTILSLACTNTTYHVKINFFFFQKYFSFFFKEFKQYFPFFGIKEKNCFLTCLFFVIVRKYFRFKFLAFIFFFVINFLKSNLNTEICNVMEQCVHFYASNAL